MIEKLAPFGLKHEISKRWTPWDWYQSICISKRISSGGADKVIFDLIALGKPALVGRLGGTEARFLGEYLKIVRLKKLSKILFKLKPNWLKRAREINSNAGFYFEDIFQVSNFYKIYNEALLDTDVLGAWGTAFAWIESRYVNTIKTFIPVPMTAPWIGPYNSIFNQVPWSSALDGKRVLIISPFTETIIKQHNIIDKVFPNNNYPKFSLATIKAPQTIGVNSNLKPDWFEKLDEMKNLMSNVDFDVALIAAGAYSYPLAHYAKQMGKIGIHAGGGLQLFFGIIGKRWEVNWGEGNYLETYFNKYWTRPSLLETPSKANEVENGCYW
jgi:hypothetical protein